MELTKRYGRRTAALATLLLVWAALASGIVPLLHHAEGLWPSGCDGASASSAPAAVAFHADGCPHGEESHEEGQDGHCPVCRTLQQGGAALPLPVPPVLPAPHRVALVAAPRAPVLAPDLPPALSPRAPPRVA
jgi:hypothetical protein